MFVSFALFLLQSAHAVPTQLSQHGRLMDSSGAAITGLHNLTFRIYDSPTSSLSLWEEAVPALFQNGYYQVALGGDPLNPLDSSVLSLTGLYMELEVDNNGAMSPRQALHSAPYAKMAGVTENLSGGLVDAAEIRIGGALVIDSNGSWVGPTATVNWADLVGVPADLLDGDDDTLSGIACSTGEILSWNGSAWSCAQDNGLTEAEVEAYVTNDPLDLAIGSSVGGDPIVTESVDQDSLAALQCQAGEMLKFDTALGWVCDIDQDSNDWNALQNIPSDLADGDDVLTEAEVEDFVWNTPVDLPSSTTYLGSELVAASNCNHGDMITYNAQTGLFDCQPFNTILDMDGDGSMAWVDCDDLDPTLGDQSLDQDCDGTLTIDDCDDSDSTSNTVFNDADCDGNLSVDDCDDADPNSTVVADDADCDGMITAADCDDADPNEVGYPGSSPTCPMESCLEIHVVGWGTGSGSGYWINPSAPFEVFCDMDASGGGWTLVANTALNDPFTGVWGSAGIGSPQLNGKYVLAFDDLGVVSEMMMRDETTGYAFQHQFSSTSWETSGNMRRRSVSNGNKLLLTDGSHGSTPDTYCVANGNYDDGYNCDGNSGQMSGQGVFNTSSSDESCNCGSSGFKINTSSCQVDTCDVNDHFVSLWFR